MRKVLVTGANGLIGRSLCQCLVANSYAVLGLVREIREPLPGVDYLELDLEHAEGFGAAFFGVDCVDHLAGRAHILNESNVDPLEAFRKANCAASLRLARHALEFGVRRFIFISSVGVNGAESIGQPFDERCAPAPHADYAISKSEAESKLKEIFSGKKSELVIIRPPLVYGVKAPGNFSRLLKLVHSGLPLPFGGVDNRRSMISLENLLSFIARCTTHPAAAGHTFLVSDGSDISTTELVQALARGMKKRPLILTLPDFLLKIFSRILGKEPLYVQLYRSLQVDCTKAQKLVGWQPAKRTVEALEDVGRMYASEN